MKNIINFTIALSLGLIVSGCSDNTADVEINEESSINKMTKSRVVLNSVEATGGIYDEKSDFFLAPLTYYSTLGNKKDDTVSEINNDGFNYHVISNVFETYFNTMKLDLIYNSEDSRDNFNNIFGLWRTSYTSYIDFNVDYENANIKSNLYDTPQDACEIGFNDIKENLHRGILKDAYVSYDSLKNLCIVNKAGEEVGEFNIFSKTYGIVGDFHYLTKPSGQTLVFSKKDDTTYISDDKGIEVYLNITDIGYEYIDADGVKNAYNTDGKLIGINDEGQKTFIDYDDRYKITRVRGPSDTLQTYIYDEFEKLTSIKFGEKEAIFSYDDKNLLASVDIRTDEINVDDNNDSVETDIDDNETIKLYQDMEKDNNLYKLASFKYNSKNLLSDYITTETIDENGTILSPKSETSYVYDELNRVIAIQNEINTLNIAYFPNIVTLEDENKITRDISYKNSKQQVLEVETLDTSLENTYNTEGQLSTLYLMEEPDVDVNGSIIAQGLEDGKKVLKAEFSYNPRGLINNIQYSSVQSGKQFVKLEYKSEYPKPTKILTQDDVTFIDYNEEGQLIKKTSVKFDKEMKLKANSITFDDVLVHKDRAEINYSYDEDGFLSSTKDVVKNSTSNYSVDENGKVQKQARLKEQWFSFFRNWLARFINFFKVGWTSQNGFINVDDSDTRTIFIGGAGDGGVTHSTVESVYDRFDTNNDQSSRFYKWNQVDPLYNGLKNDILDDNGKTDLITIGHSWGADSAVKAEGDTDLLITVDPIGRAGHSANPDAYWISIYAMAGTPHGGYYKSKWHYQTVKTYYWSVKCNWRGCKVKRKSYTKRYRYRIISWTSTMTWNSSDWTAFFGGKGAYSKYDPGEIYPNQFIKMTAHHNDFEYMLWKMEKDKRNNDFRITENSLEFDQDIRTDFINKERSYNKKEMIFKDGAW